MKIQFPLRLRSGVIDLGPYLKWRDGACESPGLAAGRIVREHYPDKLEEYTALRSQAMTRMDRLEKAIDNHNCNKR